MYIFSLPECVNVAADAMDKVDIVDLLETMEAVGELDDPVERFEADDDATDRTEPVFCVFRGDGDLRCVLAGLLSGRGGRNGVNWSRNFDLSNQGHKTFKENREIQWLQIK